MQVIPVDPSDREALLAWNALLRDGFDAEREAAWWADGASVLAQCGEPGPGRTSVLLVASLDGCLSAQPGPRSIRGAAEARRIQTCTALDYSPMLALNRALGLHEADVLSILEGELPAEWPVAEPVPSAPSS